MSYHSAKDTHRRIAAMQLNGELTFFIMNAAAAIAAKVATATPTIIPIFAALPILLPLPSVK